MLLPGLFGGEPDDDDRRASAAWVERTCDVGDIHVTERSPRILR